MKVPWERELIESHPHIVKHWDFVGSSGRDSTINYISPGGYISCFNIFPRKNYSYKNNPSQSSFMAASWRTLPSACSSCLGHFFWWFCRKTLDVRVRVSIGILRYKKETPLQSAVLHFWLMSSQIATDKSCRVCLWELASGSSFDYLVVRGEAATGSRPGDLGRRISGGEAVELQTLAFLDVSYRRLDADHWRALFRCRNKDRCTTCGLTGSTDHSMWRYGRGILFFLLSGLIISCCLA